MVERACRGKIDVQTLPSPAPDMDMEAFAIRGTGAALESVLHSLHYTADGAVEYVSFYAGERLLGSMHIDDESFLVLGLRDSEVNDLVQLLGDLSANVECCYANCDEIAGFGLVVDSQWRPLGA